MGAKECKLEDTCANKLATGKKESSVLLRNGKQFVCNNERRQLGKQRRKTTQNTRTYCQQGVDKFQIRGRISNPKDYFTSSTDTEKLTDIGKLVKCQLLRMWGGKVILLQEPRAQSTVGKFGLENVNCWKRCTQMTQPAVTERVNIGPLMCLDKNTTIATLNFTEEKVVDYIEVGLRNRIELSMPPNYEINITDGNTTVLENMKIEPDTHMKGVLNAMRTAMDVLQRFSGRYRRGM